jgi:hypothetical protein
VPSEVVRLLPQVHTWVSRDEVAADQSLHAEGIAGAREHARVNLGQYPRSFRLLVLPRRGSIVVFTVATWRLGHVTLFFMC